MLPKCFVTRLETADQAEDEPDDGDPEERQDQRKYVADGHLRARPIHDGL
jgi:hypothetical protein